jgi:hypothetical protein
MKWLFALLLVAGVAYAVAFVPPRTAAKLTARALRAGWDWVAAIGPEKPRKDPPQRVSRKAQAATPQRRASRDGIVPQPPKETLHPKDRDALDSLVANAR